jgi:hypothetical protein
MTKYSMQQSLIPDLPVAAGINGSLSQEDDASNLMLKI